MYVIVQHELADPQAAFARGERLKSGRAPRVERGRSSSIQPGRHRGHLPLGGGSVAEVQTFVDETPSATRA